jgi:hypothetical protein
MKYKVIRAFFLGAKVQEVGSVIELNDRDLIGGLKSFGKIEAVQPGEEPKTGPMTSESSGGLIGGIKPTKAKD